MTRPLRWTLLAAVAVAAPTRAAEPTPLFAGDEPIRLTITAPLGTLTRAAPSETPSVEGTLALAGAGQETLAVTLTPRGITRRKKDVCTFPPLRVTLAAKPGAKSLFKGQKKLKLVTHCRGTETFQQYLLLEYAAYKLYNRLTPLSYRVRLAQIDYVDGTKPLTSRLGFFIEDTDDLAKRNGLDKVEGGDRIPISALAARDAARFAVFEYMIGNLDWAMTAGPPGEGCCHNARLVAAKGAASSLVPVPYDFDFAGLVDAPYAVSPNEIPLPSVRVRRFRGYCRHNAEAAAAVAELAGQRTALTATMAAIPQLEERTRSKANGYLDSFFKAVDGPDGVAKLTKACI